MSIIEYKSEHAAKIKELRDMDDNKLPSSVKITHSVSVLSFYDNPKVGVVIPHWKTKELVYILSGSFFVNNNISNFFSWAKINDDGTLGKEEQGYWGK